VRHVREQRAERDDELDAELFREADDEIGEAAPAEVRLDSEQEDGILLQAGRPPLVEDGRRPVDTSRQPFDQRDMRARRLEVEEAFGVDVCKAVGSPELGKVPRGERGALAAVVPATEGSDENGTLEAGAVRDSELVGDRQSVVPASSDRSGRKNSPTSTTAAAQTAAARATCTSTIPHGSSVRHWSSPIAA
jgi:hypothetical protein